MFASFSCFGYSSWLVLYNLKLLPPTLIYTAVVHVHLGESGGMTPPLQGIFWISYILRSFLVQPGSNRDRYFLVIHLNTDSWNGGAVSASVDAVKRRGICAHILEQNLNILKNSGSRDRQGGFVCNLL